MPSIHGEKWHGGRENGHGLLSGRSRAAKSWMSKKGSCRRSCEKLSCYSKDIQESLKSNLQQQLQEVEPRRHDIMPEHQKVQKRSQKIKSIQDKRRTMQENKVLQLKRRCGRSE